MYVKSSTELNKFNCKRLKPVKEEANKQNHQHEKQSDRDQNNTALFFSGCYESALFAYIICGYDMSNVQPGFSNTTVYRFGPWVVFYKLSSTSIIHHQSSFTSSSSPAAD